MVLLTTDVAKQINTSKNAPNQAHEKVIQVESNQLQNGQY